MTIRNVSEAKAELSALLVKVEAGEEVVIARHGRPVAKLVPVVSDERPRELGTLKGQIWIAEDFDAPCPEIEEAFEGSDIEPAA